MEIKEKLAMDEKIIRYLDRNQDKRLEIEVEIQKQELHNTLFCMVQDAIKTLEVKTIDDLTRLIELDLFLQEKQC